MQPLPYHQQEPTTPLFNMEKVTESRWHTHQAGNLLTADVQGHVKLLFGRLAAVCIPVYAGFHCSIIVRMLILKD